MALSLQTAVNSIATRVRAEAVREGVPAPRVQWTGQHELRDRQLWVELKITETETNTYITGWTNGVEEHGFITFEEN